MAEAWNKTFEKSDTVDCREVAFQNRFGITCRDIYNLYHFLNHTNLFGAGYFSAVEEILGRF